MNKLEESSGKKYVRTFACSLLIILTILLGMYVKYDPYGYLKLLGVEEMSRGDKFRSHHGIAPLVVGSRFGKFANAGFVKSDAAIFGSSCVFGIMDVHHPGFKSYQFAYNFGYSGANIFEIRDSVKHAMVVNKLDLIVVGVEFYMFAADKPDAPDFLAVPKAYQPNYRFNVIKAIAPKLFSTAWLEDGFSKQEKALFAAVRDVMPNPTKTHPGAVASQMSRQDYLEFLSNFEHAVIPALYPYKWQDFRFKNAERDSLQALRDIVKMARENNSKLIVYVTANQARTYEYIHMMGLWPQYQQWLRAITTIVAEDNQQHLNAKQYAFWDFSQYNSVTMDPIKAHPSKTDAFEQYYDSIHYFTKTANLVLNRIFSIDIDQVPNDFGVLLSRDNIEQHLARMEATRHVYTDAHPDEERQQENVIARLKQKIL